MVDVGLGMGFAVLGVSFVILAWLVLRQSINRIKTTFGLGVIAFAISAFVCSLSFFGILSADFGLLGNSMMLWGPIGLLFAGKFILFGVDDWRSSNSITFLVIYVVITAIFLASFLSVALEDALIVSSSIVAFVLLYAAYEYFRVTKITDQDTTNKILFLLAGITLSVIGLAITIMSVSKDITLLTKDTQIYGGVLINFGILLAGVAFTGIPAKIRIGSVSKDSLLEESLLEDKSLQTA
ncbi:MAG: hypothetical protein ACXAC7_02740 [Candidatus Hodarchaeales archaeon]|jgi:hypothetical protein